MVYSFVVGVLCAISVWVAFGFANNHLGGTSAGFIATGVRHIRMKTRLFIGSILTLKNERARRMAVHVHNTSEEVLRGTTFVLNGID